MRSKSKPEVLAARIDAMGHELGTLFDALYNDVLWLHSKWSQLRKLFLHSPERTKSLFGTAPFFFEVLRGVFWEDVLLHIARLTDPPTQFGHENLTLRGISDLIEDDVLSTQVRTAVEAVDRDSRFARDYRDKHLAHADLGFALDRVDALPPVKPENVEAALSSFAIVINLLQEHYFGVPVAFADVAAIGDADSLIAKLVPRDD